MGDCADRVGHWQTVTYVEAASIAALLFDFCITFDSEVRWTWGRKWGIVRIAFVISRYLPVVSVPMYLYYAIESTRGGIANSRRYIFVNGTMNTFGVAAAAVLLVTRTHAFCGGEKKILIAMSFFTTAIMAATLVVLYVVSSKYGNSTCGVPEGQRFIGIIYGMHMTYQLVLMSLTLYKRFKIYRQENTPLVVAVYRDGVISMLCIALASMVNCIGIVKLPLSYSRIFYCPQAVVHSVLASRILFDIRATSESQDVVIGRPVASRVGFIRPIQTPSCVDRLELLDIRGL